MSTESSLCFQHRASLPKSARFTFPSPVKSAIGMMIGTCHMSLAPYPGDRLDQKTRMEPLSEMLGAQSQDELLTAGPRFTGSPHRSLFVARLRLILVLPILGMMTLEAARVEKLASDGVQGIEVETAVKPCGTARRAVRNAVENQNDLVVIGPERTKVGTSAAAHEHGGRYKRQRYPKRPFMGPALETTKERLPRKWAGSVKATG